MTFVDEANYAENALPVILPYTLQSTSKVFFVSSATSANVGGHKANNVLRKLKNIDGVSYDEVVYFCNEHAQQMIKLGVEALTCECYCMIGQTKKHVNIAKEDMKVMNTFQPNSFYSETVSLNEEEMQKSQFLSGDRLFAENIMQTFIDNRINMHSMGKKNINNRIIIYVDTALCTNVLSGIGIAMAATLTDGTVIIVGVDQLFLDEKTVGHAALFVATILFVMIKTFKSLNNDEYATYYDFYVIIEANLSDDMVVSICEHLKALTSNSICRKNLLFYSRKASDGGKKLGFKLNKTNKPLIYTGFINRFNEGKIRLAETLVSVRVKNPDSMIREQLERIHTKITPSGTETFSGKKPTSHTAGPADDMGLAIVVAGWFANNLTFTTCCWI